MFYTNKSRDRHFVYRFFGVNSIIGKIVSPKLVAESEVRDVLKKNIAEIQTKWRRTTESTKQKG